MKGRFMKSKKVFTVLTLAAAIAVLSGCSADIPAADIGGNMGGAALPQQQNVQQQVQGEQSVGGKAQNNQNGSISADEAKNIALKHAGIEPSDNNYVKIKEEWENGQAVYDVEFYSGNMKYDYDITKAKGEIISYEYEAEGFYPSQTSGKAVSAEDVKKAALSKVNGAGEQNIRIWEEWEDGRKVYEGEIFYNNAEYEFEADASTGQMIEWSFEKYGY